MARKELSFEELTGQSIGTPSDIKAMGAFDGARVFNDVLQRWRPPQNSTDSGFLPDRDVITARSDDTFRNDAYMQGAVRIRQDSIIGGHFILNATPSSVALFGKVDEEWEAEFQEEVETKFDLAATSENNYFDAAGKRSFSSLLRLGVGVHMVRGEMLASVEWLTKDKSRPFKTAINMLSPDRLATMPASQFDPMVRAGVRRDTFGRPIAYQIATTNPFDIGLGLGFLPPTYREISARKPWGRLQVIHLFNDVGAEQTRGIAEITAAMKELRVTKSYRDVTLQRAVAQAMYAAVITSDLPTEQLFAQLGQTQGGTFTNEMAEAAIAEYATGYLNAVYQFSGVKVDGVKVPHLFPGTDFKLLSTGGNDNRGMEFEQSLLRYIAASIGCSYEQLSRDYTNTNYSSARAAMSETWKFMRAEKKNIADRLATIIYRLWLEEMINANQFETLKRPGLRSGWLYEGMNMDAISSCEWIGSSHGQIDELKETQAAALRIDAGLSTYSDELARLGKDWRKVFRQRAREQQVMADLDLTFVQISSKEAEPGTNPQDDSDRSDSDQTGTSSGTKAK